MRHPIYTTFQRIQHSEIATALVGGLLAWIGIMAFVAAILLLAGGR